MHDVVTGYFTPNSTDLGKNITNSFATTTNIINGGLECNKGIGGNYAAVSRAEYYTEWLNFFGLPGETDLDCGSQSSDFSGGAGAVLQFFDKNWGAAGQCQLASWFTQYSAAARDDYKRCVCDSWGTPSTDCALGEVDTSNQETADGGDGTTPDPDGGDGTTPDPDGGGDGTTPDPDGGDGTTPDPDGGGDGTTPDPDDGNDGTTPDPDGGDGGTDPDPPVDPDSFYEHPIYKYSNECKGRRQDKSLCDSDNPCFKSWPHGDELKWKSPDAACRTLPQQRAPEGYIYNANRNCRKNTNGNCKGCGDCRNSYPHDDPAKWHSAEAMCRCKPPA